MSYWQHKVILVTGGSAGLGLCIARQFALAGSKVVIAARNRERLDLAAVQLRSQIANTFGTAEASESGPIEQRRVVAIETDVTQQPQVDSLMQQVLDRFGRLDGLVNCAGQSTRGEIASTTVAQFQALWEANFLSAVRCTLGALPHLVQQKGHLVHIGSLASKRAARFLGAYPASKFPLDAYAQQLRMELGPKGLHVLLVCPGPLKRTDEGSRYATEAKNLPAEANQPGGGVKIGSIDPEWLAQKVVRACEKRQIELIVPWKARLLLALESLAPRWADWVTLKMTSSGK